ncbi:homoserine kinase [Salirhabdus euzebyi]|uniref:Homoserine kinase n=1 Tax=Salirhabdus euzebyi TaxID=394506 RepID=A0A841Q4W5_9BACI|nr:homoserine kinase [Salirhabdus euzebyi]MBB6453434.1 homoserine kinase [Salirhabdus euzebyi]
MNQKCFRIKVPASTSNIGPGFDSIGIALNLFFTIECSPGEQWCFIQKDDNNRHMPEGKDNLIYQTALFVAHKFGFTSLPPYHCDVFSDIPIARGLGSSGAVTVAGVELANQILDLDLPMKSKLLIASELEGHPDNVVPSFLGGCVVAYYNRKDLYYVKKNQMNTVDFVSAIPNFELKTKMAREALPKTLSFLNSIEGSAIANMCTAAIIQEDYAMLGEIMEMDLFHQPFRKQFIPHFDELVGYMRAEGAYGTFLSGAGPTMISIFKKHESKLLLEGWKEKYPNIRWKILNVEEEGMKVEVNVSSAQKTH